MNEIEWESAWSSMSMHLHFIIFHAHYITFHIHSCRFQPISAILRSKNPKRAQLWMRMLCLFHLCIKRKCQQCGTQIGLWAIEYCTQKDRVFACLAYVRIRIYICIYPIHIFVHEHLYTQRSDHETTPIFLIVKPVVEITVHCSYWCCHNSSNFIFETLSYQPL